jgi:hypothetical protein
MYAIGTQRETLSTALGNALDHPKRRWPVIAAWVITTKHLFFRKRLRWCDPFLGVGILGSKAITVATTRREHELRY